MERAWRRFPKYFIFKKEKKVTTIWWNWKLFPSSVEGGYGITLDRGVMFQYMREFKSAALRASMPNVNANQVFTTDPPK